MRTITQTHTGKIISDTNLCLEYLYVGDYGKENNIKADFLSQLFDTYMNFDTEQHAVENYGMRGAPGLRVLLDDAEAIEGELQRLWCELSKVKETV